MRRATRSISTPIVLGSITVALGIAMLVGWILIIVQNLALSREVAQNTWLLVTGIISFSVIISVLVMFSVFLVREILEARRQVTFIDSVTHELKSPLASLKLCLETMTREDLSEKQRHELRTMMIDDVDRLDAFIDDVLEVSRLGSGSTGRVVDDVKLAPLVQRCTSTILNRYKQSPGNISIEVPEDLALRTDRTALETALKNLLDNAIKYSDGPADVRVTAQTVDDRTLMIEVKDNGIGVQRQYLRRIFNRFYRVPTEKVRSRRGTGLGLFVVSSLIRSLGGRLEAHSDGPGTGTSMRILLPFQSRAAR